MVILIGGEKMVDNDNTGSVFSKFRERLRKIRISRSKKKGQNDSFVQDTVQEIRKVLQDNSGNVSRQRIVRGYGGEDEVKSNLEKKKITKEKDVTVEVVREIKETAPERQYKSPRVGVPSKEDSSDPILAENREVLKQKEESKLEKKEIEQVSTLEKENKILNAEDSSKHKETPFRQSSIPVRRKYGYQERYQNIGENVSLMREEEKRETLEKLGTEIIAQMKKNFEEKLDELEVLESELYFLNKDQENELELKKVKEIKKRIQELIQEVNGIIDQYNLYRGNYYIDNLIGIDDNQLVDDMIDYRTLVDSYEGEKKIVREYKLLEEFQGLYRNLIKVKGEAEQIIDKNEKKIDEYDIRDKKYDDIKLQAVNVDEMNRKCSEEIERQNAYFKKLMENVHKIDREEYMTYHLRGVGNLVGQSLRYMGLLLMSPLAGLIPGIASSTLATRRMIGNIYQNMSLEEVHHVHYEAVNYDSELNHHLTSIDYTADLLDDTLRDINQLKEEFMKQYDSQIPGYEDTLKKINQIENKVIRNQNRVEIVRKNLKVSKKLNEDKMIRVRELNEKEG